MNEFDLNNINEGMALGEENPIETPQTQPTPATDEPTPVESSDANTLMDEFEEQALIQEIEEKNQAPVETPQQVTPPTQPKFQQQQSYQQPQRPQPPYQQYPQYQRPVNPQAPYAGGYAPQQNPNPYVSQPYGNAPQQQAPQGYYNAYPQSQPQQKQKMSGGLKALIIIVIAILTACVIGFTAYLAFNYEGQKAQSSDNSNSIYGGDIFDDWGDFGDGNGGSFGIPDSTTPNFTPEQSDNKTYDKSDASDKIDPDFKGIELEKKPKDANSEKYNASYTYNAVEDAVVGIACYYEEDPETYQAQGTGIIITSDGYVVTNSHVIDNSRKAYLIKVITADKKEYDAGVVGYDSRSDLAVLKIDGKNLPVAKFGDSTYTEITEEVIAIGNPSGIEFQNSVTKGIVSALDRKVSTSNNVEFIQIDAAINPGNSGGPLCNMYGQVIGINTAKIASESYEGMGFAIPSATVKEIVDDIIRNSYVTNRVKVGITGQAVTESEAGADGIQIVDITKGGPMDGTGAQKNDIITEVDGEKTTTFAEIYDVLEKHQEGDKVKIKLYRPSEDKTVEIEVKLQMDKADQ